MGKMVAFQRKLQCHCIKKTCEVDCVRMDEEQTIFKMPPKRKKINKVIDAKICKKKLKVKCTRMRIRIQRVMKSLLTPLSQSEFVGQSNELDDIKLFLRSIKNKRSAHAGIFF